MMSNETAVKVTEESPSPNDKKTPRSCTVNPRKQLASEPCYKGLKGKLLKKWDWWVYRLAHKSLFRICKENPSYGYLFELSIKDWNARQHIPDSLKKSTESFHRSLRK